MTCIKELIIDGTIATRNQTKIHIFFKFVVARNSITRTFALMITHFHYEHEDLDPLDSDPPEWKRGAVMINMKECQLRMLFA